MKRELKRRDFIKSAVGGCALCMGCSESMRTGLFAGGATPCGIPGLISPGCRGTKVRVARIYMGQHQAHWPTPKMDLDTEIQRYQAEFAKREKDFADIDFVVDRLVCTAGEARKARAEMGEVDGILLIHLSMHVRPVIQEFLAAGKPTMIFAAPYSGHDWVSFGALTQSEEGRQLDCVLTSDFDELAVAVRPFRAIHHLRQAKIIDVTTRQPDPKYLATIENRFGTRVKVIGKEPVLAAYEAVHEADARAEARRWISQAQRLVEPTPDEIIRSCRLALALQRIMDAQNATAITVDCYGSMYRQLPAFPCIGFARLNNMGLAGICESDLRSAMTFLMLQGLTGQPGFISDPTMDLSSKSAILAHCLGTPKMDGPDGPTAPYRLRTIMERQEGAVVQAFMRTGQKVTQAELIGDNQLLYFTGTIIDAPDTDRGCRTKITVAVDGDADALWRQWSNGLHRVTVYGDVVEDLRRFCKFTGITMRDEAQPA